MELRDARPRLDPVVVGVVLALLALGVGVLWLSPAQRGHTPEPGAVTTPQPEAEMLAEVAEVAEAAQAGERVSIFDRGRLRGAVVDGSGQAVPRVRVTAYADVMVGVSYNSRSERLAFESATAGPDGRFEMELAPGMYVLAYEAPQRRLARVYSGGSPGLATAGEHRVVGGLETIVGVTLVEGASVAGRVLDAAGALLEADVALDVRHEGRWVEVAAEADAPRDARFRITRVPPGRYRLRVDDADAGTVVGPDSFRLRGGTVRRDVELVVPEPGSVAGRVTDSTGRPIAGMLVRTASALAETPLGTSWSEGPQSWTDASGRYLLPRVRSGVHQLLVGEGGGSGSCLAPVRQVEVVAGRAAVRDLRLHPQGTVAGVVRDTRGRPIPGARLSTVVRGCERTARSDGSGRYELRLPVGRVDLHVDPPSERWLGARAVVPGLRGGSTREVDVRLARPGRLVGTATLSLSDSVEKAQVVATRMRSGRWPETHVGRVRRDGSYELAGLKPGRYRLVFELLGDQWVNDSWQVERAYLAGRAISPFRSDATEVAVREGVVTRVPSVSGDISATISGTVTDTDGETQAEVAITVHRQHARRWRVVGSRMTDSAGRYRYPGLQAGTYRLSFQRGFGGLDQGYYPDAPRLDDADDIEIDAGEAVDGIDIVLDTSFE